MSLWIKNYKAQKILRVTILLFIVFVLINDLFDNLIHSLLKLSIEAEAKTHYCSCDQESRN